MATRAEWFRYQAERSGAKKSAASPKAAAPEAAHDPVRAGKKAVYVLEDSAGRPSRKSTRKASNRQKTDVQYRMKRRTSESRPASGGKRGM
ncbi:MAG TPA: hypothetical protein VLD85_08505 [Anaeromyxobacteraceae bacterium]|nr:hypothetical protein [Anaeromyxobacteraceae bacterium]